MSLGQDVLVVPWLLCHLGDSPMHAEITNTTNPSSTLNPCRVCTLSVDTHAGKKSESYVRSFLGVDENGNEVCHIS